MRISKIDFYGVSNMPIAVIDYDDNSKGYLSPFRAYKFQVSGSFEGERDMGSSQVVGLKNIVELKMPNKYGAGYSSNVGNEDFVKEILKGQAMIAMVKASRGESIHLGQFGQVELSNGEQLFVNDDLDKFIEEVYIYLNK